MKSISAPNFKLASNLDLHGQVPGGALGICVLTTKAHLCTCHLVCNLKQCCKPTTKSGELLMNSRSNMDMNTVLMDAKLQNKRFRALIHKLLGL